MQASRRWIDAHYVMGACALVLLVLAGCQPPSEQPEPTPEPPTETSLLSPDIPNDLPTATFGQLQIDEFGWQTFVALNWSPDGTEIGKNGDNPTVWETYMTTSDVFDSGEKPTWGTTFVPTACESLYQDGLKILEQANKADDFFEESFNSGPLVDQSQVFARFEVLYNQSLFETVVNDGLYTADGQKKFADSGGTINFECGANADESPTGTPQVGAIMLKAVWKVLSGTETSLFHTSDALIFTPAAFSSTGEDICSGPQSVGLVGLHVVHKTLRQPNWVWATFEHVDNAPDCDSSGGTAQCPSSGTDFNFFAADCTDCASCNNAPAPNAGSSYDLDQPAQKSQLCRETPIATNDPNAATLNETYRAALAKVNAASVWQNYQMVSTQWFDVPSNGECQATGLGKVEFSDAAPPNVANVTIESYFQGNSSCIDCHGRATDAANQPSDRVFSLGQEFTSSDGI